MRKTIYYVAGAICLILAAALLATTRISETKLANFIVPERTDNSYKNHYQIGFPLPKSNFRQGAIYLPAYSFRSEDCVQEFAAVFPSNYTDMTETAEHFEFHSTDWLLQVHKYIDFMRYESLAPAASGEPMCDEGAIAAAQMFLDEFLPHRKPQTPEVIRFDNEIIVEFTGLLSGLPNRAFPTTITLSIFGEVLAAAHYFFDYEILDTADIISVRASLAKLPPQDNKVRLTGYFLAYELIDSVLIPVYHFEGYGQCGTPFVYQVSAVCFE